MDTLEGLGGLDWVGYPSDSANEGKGRVDLRTEGNQSRRVRGDSESAKTWGVRGAVVGFLTIATKSGRQMPTPRPRE